MMMEIMVVLCFVFVVRYCSISFRLIRNIRNWIGVRMFCIRVY